MKGRGREKNEILVILVSIEIMLKICMGKFGTVLPVSLIFMGKNVVSTYL